MSYYLLFLCLKLYAEYYNNLLKPLLDSRELARSRLARLEKKLAGQRKTCALLAGQAGALEQLEAGVEREHEEMHSLSESIDAVYIEHKQDLVQLHVGLVAGMQRDRRKFVVAALGVDLSGFVDVLARSRRERLEEEVAGRRVEVLGLELRQAERRRDRYLARTPQPLTRQQTRHLCDLQRRFIQAKLLVHGEDELLCKRRVARLTRNDSPELKGLELNGLRDHEDDDLILVDYEETPGEEHRFIDDDEHFHDAYDDPLDLLSEIERESAAAKRENDALRKKITDIGARKSALRLALVS